MRRTLSLIAVVLTALILQTTVFPKVTLMGAKPELMYLITIVFAMLEGPSSGAVIGFSGGLAQDFLQSQPKGATGLTLTLLGYVIGLVRQFVVTPSPLLPITLVAVGTFGGLIFYGTLAWLVGQLDAGWAHLLEIAFFSSIYNGLLTPIFFPLLRRVSERTRMPSLFGW